MIFVTVGTSEFNELLKALDTLDAKITKEIFAQIGQSAYTPKHYKWVRFIEPDKMKIYYKKADVIIFGHGAGTLFEILSLKPTPKTISVHQSNLKKGAPPYLVKIFAKDGYILYAETPKDAVVLLKNIDKFTPKQYKKLKCTIPDIIKKFIKRQYGT